MNKPTHTKVSVILKRSVHGCGKCGDIIEIKPGYARYLVNQDKVSIATPSKIAEIESRALELQKLDKEYHVQAEKDAAIISGLFICFVKPAGGQGRLYGSVGITDLVDEIYKLCGIKVSKSIVNLIPIRICGSHQAIINFADNITCKITLHVVSSQIARDKLIKDREATASTTAN